MPRALSNILHQLIQTECFLLTNSWSRIPLVSWCKAKKLDHDLSYQQCGKQTLRLGSLSAALGVSMKAQRCVWIYSMIFYEMIFFWQGKWLNNTIKIENTLPFPFLPAVEYFKCSMVSDSTNCWTRYGKAGRAGNHKKEVACHIRNELEVSAVLIENRKGESSKQNITREGKKERQEKEFSKQKQNFWKARFWICGHTKEKAEQIYGLIDLWNKLKPCWGFYACKRGSQVRTVARNPSCPRKLASDLRWES